MNDYFFNMIPREEKQRLSYIPTVPEFLAWLSTEYADRPALSDLTITYTYKEMLERVALRRGYIQKLGLPAGSQIAVLDRNSMDAVELFLAITSAGYTALMMPAALPEPAIVGSVKRFDIAALFVREEFKPLCAHLSIPVCPTTELGNVPADMAKVDKDQPAAIFFTGGTTGAPKGVVLPHRALMRGSFNGCFMPGSVLNGHRYIAMLPLSHVFGLIRSTMAVLYTGGLLYSCEDMKATIGKIPMMRPTCLVLVPGLCEILYGLTKMYGPQFLGGELKTIISGAANVPPKLIEEFDKLGIRLLAGYGMTETANLTSGNAESLERPTSVGKLYYGQEAKLVDGELWLHGDNIMLGYYKDEAATKEAMTEDGWLKTGDLARFDEDGYLYIVGRIKNIILLKNGENVSPETIEDPFYKDFRVKDCLAKVMEQNGEEVIGIEILPRTEAFPQADADVIRTSMQQLVDKVNQSLPSYARISKMVIRTEDFKRTGALKVDRKNN